MTNHKKRVSPSSYLKTNFSASRAAKRLKELRDHNGSFKSRKRFKSRYRKVTTLRSKAKIRYIHLLCKFSKLIYKCKIEPSFVFKYIDWFENLIVDHGYDRSAKIANSLAGFALRYSASHVSNKVDKLSVLSGSNIPKILKPYLGMLRGSIGQINSALTILNLHRLYGVGSSKPDISGIEKEGLIDKDPRIPDFNINVQPGSFFDRLYDKYKDKDYQDFKKSWLYVLEQTFPKRKLEERLNVLKDKSTIHISSKAGPNDQCVLGVPKDYQALRSSNTSIGLTLLDVIFSLASATENLPLLETLQSFSNIEDRVDGYVTSTTPVTGRLAIKQEHSGKSRIIAIVDQLTQSALKSMHLAQFDFLDSIKEDGTKDQDRVAMLAREFSCKPASLEDVVFSQDLTEATNRLHMDLQFEIVSQMYGPEIAKLWYILSSDRDFYYQEEDRFVRYKVGNGMGTYTSWSMLAITNHLMARLAMNLSNIPYSTDNIFYLIVGDDFACRDMSLGQNYHNLMTKIGVEISKTKGYTYETSEYYIQNNTLEGMPQVIELVKRVFMNGYELSSIRPAELLDFFSHPVHFNSTLNNIYSRHYNYYYLSNHLIDELASMTYDKIGALRHATFPKNPCHWFRDVYNHLEYSDCISKAISLDFDNPSFWDRCDDLRLTILNYGELTFNDFYLAIKFYLSKLLSKEIRKKVTMLFKLGEMPLWTGYEDRPNWFVISTRGEMSFKELMILDHMFLWVFQIILKNLEELVHLLNEDDLTEENIDSCYRAVSSLIDYISIFTKESNPISVTYKRLVREIESTILKIDPRLNFNYIMFYNDVEALVAHGRTPKVIRTLGDVFPNVSNNARIQYFESVFLKSRDGFLLSLSDPVRKAMLDLEKKLSFKVEGPHLRMMAPLDNRIHSICLNLSIEEFYTEDMSRQLSFIKNVEEKFNLKSDSRFNLNPVPRRIHE